MPIFVFGQLFIEVVLQISDIIHISCLSKMYQLVILVCSKVFAVSQIFFFPHSNDAVLHFISPWTLMILTQSFRC